MKKEKPKHLFLYWLETFLILFLIWIILSEIFELKFLIYGGLSCAVIAAICCRVLFMKGVKSEKSYFLLNHNYPRFILYFLWLLWQIILATWDITKVTLFKRKDIDPSVVWFRVNYDNPLAYSMLANSITLTPGTITIDIEDGIFSVHAVTRSCGEGVLDGSMQKKVAWLYGEEITFEPLGIEETGE